MSIPMIDCQGLAGAVTLGFVQAGFEVTTRRSLPGGFGDAAIDANRDLVPGGWEQQTGPPEEWVPGWGAVTVGTPPCSGFSLLNTSKKGNARGSGSEINRCMHELVKFAARSRGTDGRVGTEFIIFESVQGAYSQGRELMQALRALAEAESGQLYDLTHVLMSGSAVGGAQMRHRYWFVAHRVPFSVRTPGRRHVVTYGDALGDLVGGQLTWEDQPYPVPRERAESWAAKLRREDDRVNSHVARDTANVSVLVRELAPYWRPGEDIKVACARFYEAEGRRPEAIREVKWNGGDLIGWQWPCRIRPDRPGYVVTGGGDGQFIHWREDRLLTMRELSRLMSYPDAWDWRFAGSVGKASALIGKCAPVTSGRWLAEEVKRSLECRGLGRGDVQSIGDREYVHNSTNVYKRWLKEGA